MKSVFRCILSKCLIRQAKSATKLYNSVICSLFWVQITCTCRKTDSLRHDVVKKTFLSLLQYVKGSARGILYIIWISVTYIKRLTNAVFQHRISIKTLCLMQLFMLFLMVYKSVQLVIYHTEKNRLLSVYQRATEGEGQKNIVYQLILEKIYKKM